MQFQVTDDLKYLQITSIDSNDEYKQIISTLTKKKKDYRFIPSVKNGSWNGDVPFIDKKNRIVIGLYKYVYEQLTKYGYKCKILGLDKLIDNNINEESVNDFCNLLMVDQKEQPRDYQLKGVFNLLKYKRAVALLSMSSGKTLVAFMFIAYGLENNLF